MSKAVKKALKAALIERNEERAVLRKAADRLATEAQQAEAKAVEAEAACVELQTAIDALAEDKEPAEDQEVSA